MPHQFSGSSTKRTWCHRPIVFLKSFPESLDSNLNLTKQRALSMNVQQSQLVWRHSNFIRGHWTNSIFCIIARQQGASNPIIISDEGDCGTNDRGSTAGWCRDPFISSESASRWMSGATKDFKQLFAEASSRRGLLKSGYECCDTLSVIVQGE